MISAGVAILAAVGDVKLAAAMAAAQQAGQQRLATSDRRAAHEALAISIVADQTLIPLKVRPANDLTVRAAEHVRAGINRIRPFVCECHSISTMPRFQSPPRRTQRADFPLYALVFASPQGLWDLSCRGDFRP
jgi:hypothetical protein